MYSPPEHFLTSPACGEAYKYAGGPYKYAGEPYKYAGEVRHPSEDERKCILEGIRRR